MADGHVKIPIRLYLGRGNKVVAKNKKRGIVGGPDDTRLHRRQLFHWFGQHIDSDRSLTPEAKTENYLNCLEDSLTRGLWLNKPSEPDFLGKKQDFEITQPICCFTETSVSEIADHTQKYGCLGLGFPKRFVLKNGGMPVHYASESTSHPVFKSWRRLKQLLEDRRVVESLDEKILKELNSEFRYVSHFLKRMSLASQPRKRAKSKASSLLKRPRDNSKIKPVNRNYGATLPLLEEREWRIVVKETGRIGNATENPKFGKEKEPAYFLPYEVGKELFTIVVPDNRTHLALLNHGNLRTLLFDVSGPPVTILSLTDIGTF